MLSNGAGMEAQTFVPGSQRGSWPWGEMLELGVGFTALPSGQGEGVRREPPGASPRGARSPSSLPSCCRWGEEQLPDGQIQKYWVSTGVMSAAGLSPLLGGCNPGKI